MTGHCSGCGRGERSPLPSEQPKELEKQKEKEEGKK